MATSFEDILNRMRNAPHVGVPAVTNPKLPTKVEQDVAAFDARQREMPKFHFGNDSQLGDLLERMKETPHQSPKYADPTFSNVGPRYAALDAFDAKYQAYVKAQEAIREQRRQTLKKEDA